MISMAQTKTAQFILTARGFAIRSACFAGAVA